MLAASCDSPSVMSSAAFNEPFALSPDGGTGCGAPPEPFSELQARAALGRRHCSLLVWRQHRADQKSIPRALPTEAPLRRRPAVGWRPTEAGLRTGPTAAGDAGSVVLAPAPRPRASDGSAVGRSRTQRPTRIVGRYGASICWLGYVQLGDACSQALIVA